MKRIYPEKVVTSFDGTKIHYLYKKNTGACITFLHGLGAGYIAWKPLYSFLYQQGFSVLSPDLRGHGYSDKPEGKSKYNLKNAALDISYILNKEHIKKTTLVGHSYGTYLAIKCNQLFPNMIDKTILISSNFKPKRDARFRIGGLFFLGMVYALQLLYKEKYFTQIDFTTYRGRTDYDFPKIWNEIRNASTDVYIPYLTELLTFDGEDICKHIPSLLLIHGLKDICVSKNIPYELLKINKNARLIYLKNINHHPPTNCPEILNTIIMNYLDSKNFDSWYDTNRTKPYKII